MKQNRSNSTRYKHTERVVMNRIGIKEQRKVRVQYFHKKR